MKNVLYICLFSICCGSDDGSDCLDVLFKLFLCFEPLALDCNKHSDCRDLGLFRSKHHRPTYLDEMIAFVHQELQCNGQMQGYRWLHLRAIQIRFVVQQDTIWQILKLVDPQGVDQLRRAQGLGCVLLNNEPIEKYNLIRSSITAGFIHCKLRRLCCDEVDHAKWRMVPWKKPDWRISDFFLATVRLKSLNITHLALIRHCNLSMNMSLIIDFFLLGR